MKVLIVCSGNAGYISPFVIEQVDALKVLGIEVQIYPVIGKGVLGYLKNLTEIKKKILKIKPDIIHAHYGLTGLLTVLQRKVLVLITFHGSDAYIPFVRFLSIIAARLSSYNIFVEEKIKKRIQGHKKNSIIPCGIDFDTFYPLDMKIARMKLNMDFEKKYILFSSSFTNPVKNYPLAYSAIEQLKNKCELVELKNKTREDVNLLLNACDLLLLTSYSEGSPQIIKEAMAANCPIVATNVGDISEVISDSDGCFITTFDQIDVADKIQQALNFGKRTNGCEKIIHFDNKKIAKQIINLYNLVLNK